MNSPEIDLNEFISGEEQAFARLLGNGVSLRLTVAGRPARVEVDQAIVKRCVLTLLEQARQLLPGGGNVELLAEHIEVDETHARIQPGARCGDFVRLTVRDNGLGLPPAGLKRLMEQSLAARIGWPGHSQSCAALAALLQPRRAWLEAVSQEGCGTEFRIYFPSATTPAAVETAKSKVRMTAEKETILLVDDEEIIRRMVKQVLLRASYDVIEAETGLHALQIWDAHKSRVDLLLTDMVMPDGVTGRELARQLVQSKPELQVIYTSGFDLDPITLRETREGCVQFLQKPYDMRRLLDTVRAALVSPAKMASAMAARSTA